MTERMAWNSPEAIARAERDAHDTNGPTIPIGEIGKRIARVRAHKTDKAAARQAAQEKRERERESARRERIDRLEADCKGWETAAAGHEADVRKREADVKEHRGKIDLEQVQIRRAKGEIARLGAKCRAARKRLAALRK